ncbi:MAG: inositol monophosphatase family protein [Candidatus Celaenobacter polaris]|nr:inositol monophosphatase family protein [Candidatus Celaenobacter polaris]
MKDYLDIALEACTKAGDIIRENFHKKKLIDYKGRINLVTNVDREAEKVVVETIQNYYPKHNILTEETEHEQNPGQEYCWVIDPPAGGRHHELCAWVSICVRIHCVAEKQ